MTALYINTFEKPPHDGFKKSFCHVWEDFQILLHCQFFIAMCAILGLIDTQLLLSLDVSMFSKKTRNWQIFAFVISYSSLQILRRRVDASSWTIVRWLHCGWFRMSTSSSWKLSPVPLTPPPFPPLPHSSLAWTQRETSLGPDSAFSQSVKLLPRRVGGFYSRPGGSSAGGPQWSREVTVDQCVSRRSQSLPANPTQLFLQQFSCDVIGLCLPLRNTK